MAKRLSLKDQLLSAAKVSTSSGTAKKIDEMYTLRKIEDLDIKGGFEDMESISVDALGDMSSGISSVRKVDIKANTETNRKAGASRAVSIVPNNIKSKETGKRRFNPSENHIKIYLFLKKAKIFVGTHSDLCEQTGTSLGTARRILRIFEAAGIITISSVNGVGKEITFSKKDEILEKALKGKKCSIKKAACKGTQKIKESGDDFAFSYLLKQDVLDAEYPELCKCDFWLDNIKQAIEKRKAQGVTFETFLEDLSRLNGWCADEKWLAQRKTNPANSLFIMLSNGVVKKPLGYLTAQEKYLEELKKENVKELKVRNGIELEQLRNKLLKLDEDKLERIKRRAMVSDIFSHEGLKRVRIIVAKSKELLD